MADHAQHRMRRIGKDDPADAIEARQIDDAVHHEDVAHRDAIRELGFNETSGRVRQQHLSTVPCRRDPGCPVHIDADVACAAELAVTGVQSHPDLDPMALRRRRGGKRTLGGNGGTYRPDCGRERGKE